jgi:hypothetical protein
LDIWEIFANIFETKMIELQRLTVPAHGKTKTRQICFENEKSRMNRLMRKKRESMTQYPFKFYKPQIPYFPRHNDFIENGQKRHVLGYDVAPTCLSPQHFTAPPTSEARSVPNTTGTDPLHQNYAVAHHQCRQIHAPIPSTLIRRQLSVFIASAKTS